MIEAPSGNGRTEEQDLFGSSIPVAMGSATYGLRPLSMDAADQWEERIRAVLGGMLGKLAAASGGLDSILGLYHASIDSQLDAMYAYDELGGRPVLPARAALRMVASRDDVDVALRKLVKHEFPLLKGMDFLNAWLPADLRGEITKILMQLLPETPSAPPLSGNGSSTNTLATKTRRPRARR